MVLEHSGVFQADGLQYRNTPAVVTTATGKMGISKGRQGRKHKYCEGKFVSLLPSAAIFGGANRVRPRRVYLANLRLEEVGTDVLITAYEPMLINPLSESASTVGAGLAVPAAQSGCMPMAEVFKLAVSSFKVNDWSLFDAVA
ncbi:Mog1/PsbP/DUF1795-like photosystem II reaction center PsbP family protein [Forsythia ovata]|uniref:Mog1/PsbP/DUF1795-like photosystem II reaction center PsbP family protein n=1 Tax=Forsythia ovata TaxID=205694 RepID=A0ABD1R5K9_9LAMI